MFAMPGGKSRPPARPVNSSTPVILDEVNAPGSVANSNAATAVYTKSIPGGLLGTSRRLKLEMPFEFLNNTGAGANLQITATYGGTTIADTGAISWSTSANKRSGTLDIILAAKGAANAQVSRASFTMTPAGSVNAAMQAATSTDFVYGDMYDTPAVDSSVAKDLVITVTLGSASVNLTFAAMHASLALY